MTARLPTTTTVPAAPVACPPSAYTLRFLRAKVKALESGLDVAARRLARGVYRVPSLTTPGQWYVVWRDDLGYWCCECEAAAFGRPCVHVGALVALEERGEIAPARTGPARITAE